MFNVHVITLFPEAFPGVLGLSLTGRALREGRWRLGITDLREFGRTKHHNVDDTPFGGGAGLVLRADVLDAAITAARANGARGPLIALSPRGRPFTQAMAGEFANGDSLTLIAGRFEGFDQRVLDHHDILEVSLGDFVMTGGEIAAQALIDATVRLIDGTVGNPESLGEESFSHGLLEHPQYTKPAEWAGRMVPAILLSGHHGDIAKWRKAQSERLTKERRPDLWRAYIAANGEAEQSDGHKTPKDGARSKK